MIDQRADGMSLAVLLQRSARRFPSTVAVRQGDDEVTYAELADRVARLASGIARLGLAPGDRIGIVARNGRRLLETLLACFHGGFVAVPVNARSTPYEVAQVAATARPAAWVHGPEYVDHIPPDGAAIAIGLPGAEAPLSYEGLIGGELIPARPARLTGDAAAWMFFTSGTTGRMKGAVLSHRNLLAMVQAFLSDIRSYQPGACVLHAAPLTHGSGLYALPPLARAATQVITTSTSFDPDEVLDRTEREHVTGIAFLAPTMLNRVVEAQQGRARNLSSLIDIVYGGAPMYRDDIVPALDVLGDRLTQIYGQAEAPVTIARLTGSEHVAALAEGGGRIGSVGTAYTSVEVAVAQDGEIVDTGTGEVVVRGDVVMRGYWEDEGATAAALADGWLHTGDVARIDEAGYVYLLDRHKDVIISGGANIYPREVEEIILEHPMVREVAVVGAPDAAWGERVVAIMSLRDAGDVDRVALVAELDAACRERLSGYKIPRQFDWSDDLPKSPYGKILKRELRDTYWQGHERQI